MISISFYSILKVRENQIILKIIRKCIVYITIISMEDQYYLLQIEFNQSKNNK